MRRFLWALRRGLDFAVICFILSGCALQRTTGGLNDATVKALDQEMARVVDMYFDARVAADLKEVQLHYAQDLHAPLIGGKIGGYYNPITDAITLDATTMIGEWTVVHEFAHRVWFANLSHQETRNFRIVMTRVAGDERYKDFAVRVHAGLARRHWLNDFFARSTEAYSDIAEMLVNPARSASVPEEIRRCYIGVLKIADTDNQPKQEDTPDSD